MTTYGNLTIPVNTSSSSVYVIGGGSGGHGGTSYAWTQPYYSTGTSGLTQIKSSLTVDGNADISGTVRIQGQDITELLNTINQRLAILVPDPKLMDKYTALKEAYDHYKTLEALCVESHADRTEK